MRVLSLGLLSRGSAVNFSLQVAIDPLKLLKMGDLCVVVLASCWPLDLGVFLALLLPS